MMKMFPFPPKVSLTHGELTIPYLWPLSTLWFYLLNTSWICVYVCACACACVCVCVCVCISSFKFKPLVFQPLSQVWLFVTPWTVARPASLSFSWSLLKLMSIESVVPFNHLILCCPLLFLPSVFPSIGLFPNESALRIRWTKYWSFSFSYYNCIIRQLPWLISLHTVSPFPDHSSVKPEWAFLNVSLSISHSPFGH